MAVKQYSRISDVLVHILTVEPHSLDAACPLPSRPRSSIYQARQSSETSEQLSLRRFQAQHLSLKQYMSSGQRHLVPAAPEACQILRRTTTHFRCQQTQHNAGELLVTLLVFSFRMTQDFSMGERWSRFQVFFFFFYTGCRSCTKAACQEVPCHSAQVVEVIKVSHLRATAMKDPRAS